MDHSAPISATPSSSRKRSRENETESQRNKREKAAERQRRKRERDRQAGLNNLLAMTQAQQQVPPPLPPPEEPVPPPQDEPSFSLEDKGEELSPDEQARREKVRAAARERQRKHRALVKQKKLRELGLDMGNELMPGMDEVQYRLTADGQYQVPMHELAQHPPPHPGQHPHAGMHEPPFPQGQPLGGQTFASTLLLSFSCAPLLKAHLLRTLNMTNDELASLEPIIAQAWDHWDQQRRMHYAQNQGPPPNPPDGQHVPDGNVQQYPPPLNVSHALNHAPVQHQVNHQQYVPEQPQQGSPNDFRARFHRPLVAPSPFQPQPPAMSPQAAIAAVAAAAGAAAAAASPQQKQPDTIDPSGNLDPQLGQARDEAVSVAKQLDRS